MSSLPNSEDSLEQVTKSLELWKKLIEDVYEDDEIESNNQFNLLKKHVEAYAELDKNIEKTNTALQKLDEKLDTEVKCEDVNSLYQDIYNGLPSESSSNFKDTRIWQAVFQGVSDVTEVRKKKKKIADTDFEELEDSILCSNVFAPPIDPISKVVVKNAYKNRKCGHVYEYDTITDYIRKMKTKAKCPYIGCNKVQLKMTDLVQDSILQSQISQFLENHTNEESEEDDD